MINIIFYSILAPIQSFFLMYNTFFTAYDYCNCLLTLYPFDQVFLYSISILLINVSIIDYIHDLNSILTSIDMNLALYLNKQTLAARNLLLFEALLPQCIKYSSVLSVHQKLQLYHHLLILMYCYILLY